VTTPTATTRRAVPLMGTVFSFCLLALGDRAGRAIDAAVAELCEVDAAFSPFRTDSLVSRVRRRELAPAAYPRLLAEVVRRCDEMKTATDGWFDPWALPDGFDPSGLVKGWSIEQAAARVVDAGVRDFAISGGGDVLVRGIGPTGQWRVGIRGPNDPQAVVMVLELTDAAVATSGSYERGPPVIDPHTAVAATSLASATVVGPDLATADAYATALYAAGPAGLCWFVPGSEYHALTIDGELTATFTDGLPEHCPAKRALPRAALVGPLAELGHSAFAANEVPSSAARPLQWSLNRQHARTVMRETGGWRHVL
jgi:thiamine biosynthesis lipoprotein